MDVSDFKLSRNKIFVVEIFITLLKIFNANYVFYLIIIQGDIILRNIHSPNINHIVSK